MKYPSWVCSDCGKKALAKFNASRPQYQPLPLPVAATFHEGDKCDICQETKPVTEPRDYNYPPLEAFEFKL